MLLPSRRSWMVNLALQMMVQWRDESLQSHNNERSKRNRRTGLRLGAKTEKCLCGTYTRLMKVYNDDWILCNEAMGIFSELAPDKRAKTRKKKQNDCNYVGMQT